jgi:hypothetical protein
MILNTLEDKKKNEEKVQKITIRKPDSPNEKKKKDEKELSKKRVKSKTKIALKELKP